MKKYNMTRAQNCERLVAMGDKKSSGATRNNDTGANWRVAYWPVSHGSRSDTVFYFNVASSSSCRVIIIMSQQNMKCRVSELGTRHQQQIV